MKRARRVILIALVFLLIGAGVNIGVAWSVAWLAADGAYGTRSTNLRHSWPRRAPDGWPTVTLWAVQRMGFGYQEERCEVAIEREAGGADSYTMRVAAAGWPVRSMESQRWQELGSIYSGPMRSMAVPSLGGYGTPGGTGTVYELTREDPGGCKSGMMLGGRHLPIAPLWPGFAINTLLYAVLAMGAWYLPSANRRARRRLRGQCVACGYSRAGLTEGAVCPECGGGQEFNGKLAKNAKKNQER